MKIREEILELIGKLIENITGINDENRLFYELRDKILNMIKDSQFITVNNFEIKRSCYGLVEKFDILSEEEDSSMLEILFNELFIDKKNDSMIDIIFLILSLSDNPCRRKRIYNEESVEDHVSEGSIHEIYDSPFIGEHWEEFNIYDEEEIEEEEEEEEEEEKGEKKDITFKSFIQKKDTTENVKTPLCVSISMNIQEFSFIEASQYWRTISCQNDVKRIVYKLNYNSDVSTILHETNVVSEVIFMLQGNESILFSGNSHNIKINENFGISKVSHQIFMNFMEWFLEKGKFLNKIRNFISKSYFKSYLENVFISSVEDLLRSLDSILAYCQSIAGNSGMKRTLTLLYLQDILDKILNPYIVLSDIISEIDDTAFETNISDFLNKLFDKANFYSICDQQTFLLITIIRSALLEAYLKPLDSWFSCGELPDIQGFFITKSTLRPNDLLWLSEYQLNLANDGKLLIPDVLKKISEKSLLIGKLKRLLVSIFSKSEILFLDIDRSIFQQLNSDYEIRLKLFSTKMNNVFDSNLFYEESEILGISSEYNYLLNIFNWVDKNYYASMKNFRHALFHNADFEKHLNTIINIYCMYNNSNMINFINFIFEEMDRRKTWCDKFVLQDMIQISLKHSSIDTNLINIRMKSTSGNNNLSNNFYIDYKLPLSLTSIISSSSQSAYYKIFDFMFQLLKSRHDIKKYIFLFSNKSSLEKSSTLIYRNLSQIKLYFNWLINVLISYFFDIIIKTQIENLQKNIKNAADLDEIINAHNMFINSVLTYCFLNLRFKRIHDSIMEIFIYVKSVSDLIISFQEKSSKKSLHTYFISDDDISNLEIDNKNVTNGRLKNEEILLKNLVDIQKKTYSILKFIISELQELPQELTSTYIEILMENIEYAVLDIES
ncbi:hypothetical protein T552_00993 [Pneumocystis carinii B80]|uniref:Spindle pole body component n=1 Tax=Pneumocystis carinii (strain B80) TaxID=1408658 RepID=A0A0W4ZN42_PNEC8|nr:hypothetical protein T552_00993 [Pneumocystis carinii B80]KTW29788.1 hypothetical protein T552_00993 [Pneumocystis carinii B80]